MDRTDLLYGQLGEAFDLVLISNKVRHEGVLRRIYCLLGNLFFCGRIFHVIMLYVIVAVCDSVLYRDRSLFELGTFPHQVLI
jgi:hypothetical protein